MTLTTAQQVRLRLADAPLLADVTRYGDGTATVFTLAHTNLTSGTAYVPLGATAWTATGATFNASGTVAFSGVISANSAFRVTYVHSTFSDDEIGHFTAVGGTVAGAALEAVGTLMFDAVKRARWSSPDGTSFDDTAAMSHLQALYDRLRVEQGEAAVGSGSLDSWSVEQEHY